MEVIIKGEAAGQLEQDLVNGWYYGFGHDIREKSMVPFFIYSDFVFYPMTNFIRRRIEGREVTCYKIADPVLTVNVTSVDKRG